GRRREGAPGRSRGTAVESDGRTLRRMTAAHAQIGLAAQGRRLRYSEGSTLRAIASAFKSISRKSRTAFAEPVGSLSTFRYPTRQTGTSVLCSSQATTPLM